MHTEERKSLRQLLAESELLIRESRAVVRRSEAMQRQLEQLAQAQAGQHPDESTPQQIR